ncbi:hypothetical protein [Streptomyces peucetius]|uniref:hypothetical protein n=2 Tax=Streptomyces TaxID=1883 RepID=UPI00131CCA23|nr:hypothetical protein [Streptomyces peucetius]
MREASEGMTQSGLLLLARDKYNCSWNSLDQIRRRTAWLRSSGMAELDFNHKILPTRAGGNLLESLELAHPGCSRNKMTGQIGAQVKSIPQAHALVQECVDQADLVGRRHSIGYIPRSEGDAFTSLRKFVCFMREGVTREAIDEFASSGFGLRPSSTVSALSMLKNAGLVEQVGFNLYQSTDLGKACVEASHNVDILRVFHSRFSFIGEMLEAMEEADTPRDLAALGRKRYGLPREDIAEVRTRLQMLRKCGLVEEVVWGRYRLLPAGRLLRLDLPIAGPGEAQQGVEEVGVPVARESRDESAELIAELVQASLHSAHPERFERAVAEAFSFLGFDSHLLGASGKTDVLIYANLSQDMRYGAIIDAKTSSSGKVAERQIDFDTLGEHRSGNAVEYALVVGPGFSSARMIERAASHEVGLLEVGTLVEIVKQHRVTPLSLSDLREQVQGHGLIELSTAEKVWANEKRLYRLCDRVIRQLETEARNADVVTTGALSSHDLYLILRSEVEEAPLPDEIESVLAFLSSPLVRAVRKMGQQYASLEAPRITAMRLRALVANFTTGGGG